MNTNNQSLDSSDEADTINDSIPTIEEEIVSDNFINTLMEVILYLDKKTTITKKIIEDYLKYGNVKPEDLSDIKDYINDGTFLYIFKTEYEASRDITDISRAGQLHFNLSVKINRDLFKLNILNKTTSNESSIDGGNVIINKDKNNFCFEIVYGNGKSKIYINQEDNSYHEKVTILKTDNPDDEVLYLYNEKVYKKDDDGLHKCIDNCRDVFYIQDGDILIINHD